VNVRLGDRRPDAVMAATPVRDAVSAAEAELGTEGRVLLRPSGTEPLIRVMVEGTDAAAVDRLAHRLADGVRQSLGASG
jgi:phosphoglucosamine mutase